MIKQTKEEQNLIEEKLKEIKLDLENIPQVFLNPEIINYRAKKGYEETSHKIYKYVDVKDIEIYLTPTTRLDDVGKKYKLSKPLICYLQSDNEENIEEYIEFLNMTKKLDLAKLEQISEEQKKFEKQIPYEVKYKDNFMWDVYYSEMENKYFMLFPTKESQVETLFYLIKEKIKNQKSKKDNKIYIPINQEDYTYNILKKSEISDIENYLWLFTKNWPLTYEVENKDKKKSIQIVGQTPVYEGIKSKYKIVLNNKEEAQEQFKLIKALFILQSHLEQNYKFTTIVNQEGSLDFCLNRNKISYESLPNFINNEINKNIDLIKKVQHDNLLQEETLLLLEESVKKQKEEYMNKEKQIVMFLECKKTFFGRVSYYLKSRKKKKVNLEEQKSVDKKDIKIKNENIEIEKKDFYTIEDLLKVCEKLEKLEKEYKNKKMDVAALENKKENLERKIKNATLYINEIENHKKSIFEFWKYTNKDEVSLLQEGQEDIKEENKNRIKKIFSYKEDIEEFGEKVDQIQRNVLDEKQLDSIYAISKDLETFNLLNKSKVLKKDEKQIEKNLIKLKEQYENDFEKIKEKDFDIFGGVVEDKTKIKTLKNKKHREIEKNIYEVLNIHKETTLEEYEDIVKHYLMLLNDNYKKIQTPLDISIYQISNEELKEKQYDIFNLSIKEEIENIDLNEENIILNKINVKENMSIIFYSNIMYYSNINKTLPLGMDVNQKVLIDLNKYETKLVSRKDFKINIPKDELENVVKTVSVYEYDIEGKDK